MTPTDFPDPLIIEPSTKHDLTVVLLHGRGSTSQQFSEDFFGTRPSCSKSLQHHFPSVRWVFPSANHRRSTVFQEDISECYDVYSLSDPEERLDLQKAGLVESIAYITDIVESERDAVEKQPNQASQSSVIVLGGISMGCAVGMHVLLNLVARKNAQDIRGFFGWCGWLPFAKMVRARIQSALAERDEIAVLESVKSFYLEDVGISQPRTFDRDIERHYGTSFASQEGFASIPILLSHCTDDNVVAPELGQELRDTLKSLEMQVEWREYANGGHWIKEPEAMDDFVTFLERLRLPSGWGRGDP